MKQQQARAPNRPDARLNHAVVGLTQAVTELIYLSAEDRRLIAQELEILRTRRQQLSAVIDRLMRYADPAPKPPSHPPRTHPTPAHAPPPEVHIN
jgi:hypothetical protein